MLLPDRFVILFHRRWAVPVLSELHRSRGAKFITLHERLGVSRETLRVTLDDLIEEGWVQRNLGHGHPMRPEYLLAADGRLLAPSAARLMRTVRRMGIEPLAFMKWTMPLTWVLGHEPHRFGQLRARLPDITSRALTLSLKGMQTVGLVRRDVYDEYPPVTSYALERRARPVYRALRPLVSVV